MSEPCLQIKVQTLDGDNYSEILIDPFSSFDVHIGGDKWEINERDGRLAIRLLESNRSFSRSLTVIPLAQNSIELGTVYR